MATDDIPDAILADLVAALREYADVCTPTEHARLVQALDNWGVEVAGINVPDQPPSGGAV